MFVAYREYSAAKRSAAQVAVPTLLGGVLAVGAVAAGGGDTTVVVASAIGLLAILTLYAMAVGRRAAARARLEAILDSKLRESTTD